MSAQDLLLNQTRPHRGNFASSSPPGIVARENGRVSEGETKHFGFKEATVRLKARQLSTISSPDDDDDENSTKQLVRAW